MDITLLLSRYRDMVRIRRFEEEAARAYSRSKIGGFLHLYIGQEAVAVGVNSAIEPIDYIVATYRDHGHYLARVGDMNAVATTTEPIRSQKACWTGLESGGWLTAQLPKPALRESVLG